jgi:hypothetical protein
MNPVFAPDEPLFDSHWPPRFKLPKWPNDFRKFMFWTFLASAIFSVPAFLYLMSRPQTLPLLRSMLVGPVFCVYLAAISGVAAWTIWKADPSARGWAIMACLTYILMFLTQFIIPVRPAWDHDLLPLCLGLVGVVSFAWPDRQVSASPT